MTLRPDLSLEQDIHDFLCGQLPAERRYRLLRRLSMEESARQVAREMAQTQQASRAALGYDGADAEAASSLKQWRASQSANRSEPGAGRMTFFRAVRRADATGWLLRAAAMVVMAASVYVAVAMHHSNVLLSMQLSQRPRQTDAAGAMSLTAAELENYRTVWRQIVGQKERGNLWVMLSNGGGEFGYLAAEAGPRGKQVALRCQILSAEGNVLERANLLLPMQAGHLNIPEAGRLFGQPCRYEITSSAHWTGVALSVGGLSERAGVSGRVRIGETPSQIGQFRLNGQELRLVVQAVPLEDGELESSSNVLRS